VSRARQKIVEARRRRVDLIAALKLRRLTWTEPKAGVHYVVRFGANGPDQRVFDFWPGTGVWRERDNRDRPGALAVHRTSRRSGEGLDSLLAIFDGWSAA
jgi:hypothetical protein